MQGGDTEILSESPGISHELFDELGNGERDRFCSEEPLAGTNEDEDQGKVKGIDGVAGDLHNGLVQLEEPGGEEADEGGGSHDWEDARLVYTSDAADELACVDLGGRGSIKKIILYDIFIYLPSN